MLPYSKIKNKTAPFKVHELGRTALWVKIIQVIAGSTDPGKKLFFYAQFLGFIKLMALHLLVKNALWNSLKKGIEQNAFISLGHERIMQSLVDLLLQYQVATLKNGELKLHPTFQKMEASAFSTLELSALQNNMDTARGIQKKLLRQYLFINNLIARYQQAEKGILTPDNSWNKLILAKKLDYEIRLCETLQHLQHSNLSEKLNPDLHESYYTGSGENAFKRLTQAYFEKALTHISQKHSIQRVLDIGCGSGEHIQSILKLVPGVEIMGYELQQDIAEQTTLRFTKDDGVTVINDSIFKLPLKTEAFDVVLLNYVLFYFSPNDKRKLFELLHQVTHKGSRILICQYYPGIENLKIELAKRQHDYGLVRKIEMYYSEKILYANALWNDMVVSFQQAEKWNEFEALLSQCGFEIEAVNRAERFYYSLFVSLKKTAPTRRK